MTQNRQPVSIHGVTEKQTSPVAGNGPPLGLRSVVSPDPTKK